MGMRETMMHKLYGLPVEGDPRHWRACKDHAVFISSGSTLDRLWYAQDSGRCCVSNSLPALLAVAGPARGTP